jgi:hypothetical protein
MSRKNHPYHRACHLLRFIDALELSLWEYSPDVIEGTIKHVQNEFDRLPEVIRDAAFKAVYKGEEEDRYTDFQWINRLWRSSKHYHWFFIRNEQNGHGQRYISRFRLLQFMLDTGKRKD